MPLEVGDAPSADSATSVSVALADSDDSDWCGDVVAGVTATGTVVAGVKGHEVEALAAPPVSSESSASRSLMLRCCRWGATMYPLSFNLTKQMLLN
mmetsp:Transcript_100056/g.305875  ORF Transcript_100056/g.305875 Transcript_100056/m.305875 type:complete len:96 (-) Transcript_100056:600-887(-)